VLELQAGYSVTGNVVAFSAADTLRLGGANDASFDVTQVGAQYQNFGLFAKSGTGTWTLINTTTALTPWTVSAGALNMSSDAALGAASGGVTLNGGTLQFGAAVSTDAARGFTLNATTGNAIDSNGFDATIAGRIAGPGGFSKIGAGKLTLAGVNTYNGSTDVNGGTLSVSGSIASSAMTTVNAGGTLGGNGIVGHTTINGGTLAPGNSIGLLTVQGNLAFLAASSYVVEVSQADADRTSVTGTATLGGATVNASFALGSHVARQYTILTAEGGVSGTFGSLVDSNLPSNFTSSLSYDASNVFLNLALNFAVPSNGLNINQRNVAIALTNFFNTSGGIPLVFGALTPAELTQVSGESATGSQQATFDAMNLFIGVLTDPFTAGRSGAGPSPWGGAYQFADDGDANTSASMSRKRTLSERDAYGAITKASPRDGLFDPRWNMWAAGFGGTQTTDGNATLGSDSATSRIYGVAVGADYWLSPYTVTGFALAGGGTNFSVANGGTGRSDLFQIGAFARHSVGAAYITGALAYGWQDITTDRTIDADRLRARFDANAFAGRLESGYRFATPWMGVTPYVAGQFTAFDLPAYAEQAIAGADTFALDYASKTVTASRSELGLRADKSYALADSILTLRGRVAWAHNFDPDRNVGATFQALPGASFVVNGAAQAHDAALTTASAEISWSNGLSLAATFEGEFSDETSSYAGKGVARYNW
jgi:autotransporter-associated beta strand protein